MSYVRRTVGGALTALLAADWWPAEKAYSGLEEGAKASSKNVVELADDVLYVANPEHAPELLDFQRWGLDVIDPDKPDKGFPYWENLSWENADKYQPDLLLIDDRTYESTLKQGEEQPTWSTIKAADAKAYVPWPAYWMHTYGEYAEQLTQLTAAIEKADPELA